MAVLMSNLATTFDSGSWPRNPGVLVLVPLSPRLPQLVDRRVANIQSGGAVRQTFATARMHGIKVLAPADAPRVHVSAAVEKELLAVSPVCLPSIHLKSRVRILSVDHIQLRALEPSQLHADVNGIDWCMIVVSLVKMVCRSDMWIPRRCIPEIIFSSRMMMHPVSRRLVMLDSKPGQYVCLSIGLVIQIIARVCLSRGLLLRGVVMLESKPGQYVCVITSLWVAMMVVAMMVVAMMVVAMMVVVMMVAFGLRR